MNKLNLVLKLLVVVTFALFFSIIGINKKTIDSYNNKNELKVNINNLRGIIWANYTFITISLSIALTMIIAKRYYQKYKWTVLFGIFFILLNTGLNVFEELTIREYETVEISHLNNIYIISSIMNIVYFMLFVRLIKITDDISNPMEHEHSSLEEQYPNGPCAKKLGRGYVPYDEDEPSPWNGRRNSGQIFEDEEPSYFEGAYGGIYGETGLNDNVEFDDGSRILDDDMELRFEPKERTRTVSF